MSTATVAVVGLTGLVGSSILPSLLASPRLSLRLLSTSPSAPALLEILAATPSPSTVVREIDWAEPETLVEALKGVDVLVSALNSRGDGAFERWLVLIQAAAGVKVYFPSEFGTDPSLSARTRPDFEEKAAHKAAAASLGLKTYHIYTGMFLEGGMSEWNGINLNTHTWTFASEGNTPFAFTSTRDLGPIVLRSILLAVDHPSLLPPDGSLQVFSSCSTWNTYASTWESITGSSINKIWRSKAELEKEGIEGGDFPAFVKLVGEEGGFDHTKGNVLELLERDDVGGKWEKKTFPQFAKEWKAQNA